MELLKNLNDEQKSAVTHGEGPLLIVAGAGTGKTTVITQRIAWLIAQGKAKSDQILAVTFTDKAAGEMSERVDRLLPLGYLDLWVSTFHAFCQRVLQDHALDIGLPGDFKLLNQTAQWLLIRQELDRFNLDYYRPLGNPTKFIHALLKHFSRAKDEAISPQEYLDYAEQLRLGLDVAESTGGKSKVERNKSEARSSKSEKKSPPKAAQPTTEKFTTQNSKDNFEEDEVDRISEVANAYHTYQQILLENNALDFGDLINYTLKLFEKRPKILEKYRWQFSYILVDEFQDTNWAQYELIKLLATPRNNLTLVGDDEQSIYKFRGASVSNILQFHKDYPRAEFVTLTTNYRSKQGILDESHKFIQLNNPNRLEGQVINGKKIDKSLKAHNKGEAEIQYILYEDQYDEATGVAQKIIEIARAQKSQTVSWNDFAVLIRANSQAENFISALENAGLPYQYVASRGLYTKPVILDIINFLKLLDDYHESPALWRVLNWPVFNFKPQTLVGINHFARKKALSLYQAIHWWSTQSRLDELQRDEIKKVIDLVEKYTRQAQSKRPREIILGFLEDSGYLKWLSNQAEYHSEQQLHYLNQFDSQLKEFEARASGATVKLFLGKLEMELESGESGILEQDLDAGPEMIKLMTIHAAKGLEFKYVFIVNLVDKRFPSIERNEPIELSDKLIKEQAPEGDIHLQEERRLMYVAMTRAKEAVYLTAAKNYGGKTEKKPSRFIHELGLTGKEIVIEKVVATKHKPDQQQLPAPGVRRQTDYVLPKKISFTQLKSFENCPYQYRFAHILKVPVRANYTLSFGKTMHATLKRFMEHFKQQAATSQGDLFGDNTQKSPFFVKALAGKQNSQEVIQNTKIPELKELLKIYEEEWIDDWYNTAQEKAKYRENGKKILKEFHERVKNNPPDVTYLEQGFNLKIQDTENKKVYTIYGVIDRVDSLADQQVEIIDYKTGTVKDEKTVEKDQLLLYQIAAQEVLGLKPQKLTFYYLDAQKPVSFLGTSEELDKMKKKILDFAEQVSSSDFHATPSPMTCRFCDYRNICEFRQV